MTEPGDIGCQGREGKLGCGDVIAVGLQALDHRAPTGTIRPSAVNKNDVRPSAHFTLIRGHQELLSRDHLLWLLHVFPVGPPACALVAPRPRCDAYRA